MRRFLIALLLAITAVGAMAQTTIPPGVSIQDEGVAQGRAQTLNCTGAGVACSVSSGTATVNVAGGGGTPGGSSGNLQTNNGAGGFGAYAGNSCSSGTDAVNSIDASGTVTCITPSGSGAPTTAQYLVGALDAGLSAERLVTNTASATWDLTVAGQARVNVATGGVTNALLRDSGALSVIGRSANSTGSPADISATAASDAVLRESGSAVGFGQVATAGIANAAVSYAKIQNVSASVLLGRGSSGGGSPQEITVGTNLTLSGTTLSATGGSDPWTTLTASGDTTTTGAALNPANVTGISFSASANTNYLLSCWLIVASATTANGMAFQWDTPASPTDVYGMFGTATTTAAMASGMTNGDASIEANTLSISSTNKRLIRFDTLFRNGANSGTTQLQVLSESAAATSTITVYQNSVCQYRSL